MRNWSNKIKSASDQGGLYFGMGSTVHGFLSEVSSPNNDFVKNEVILPEIHRNEGRFDSRCITTHSYHTYL